MARQYGAPKAAPGAEKSKEYEKRKDESPKPKDSDPSPPVSAVVALHRNAPVDTRAEDIHHTLGPGDNQAARGSHNHQGGDSVLLFEGRSITGSKASPATVLPSIINLLASLGARDETT